MRLRARTAIFAVLGLLCACSGGGSNGTSSVPSSNTSGSVTGSTGLSVQIGSQPTTAAIPVVAQITGTLSFPAVPTSTVLQLEASTTAPPGVVLQDATRKVQQSSGTLTVYEYLTIVAQTTITLPSIPAFTLNFPSSVPLAGKRVYYGISDANSQGGLVSFDTQGPGTVKGQTVAFALVATPITFKAGHRYTFVLYSTSTSAAAGLLYVANAGNNSITAYAIPANGDVVPALTISGSATLLATPQSLGVDGSGTLWVLSASGVVTAYAPGANGNVAPIHHFTVPANSGGGNGLNNTISAAIGVSKDGTKLLVATFFTSLPAPGYGIGTYDVNGTLQSVVTPSDQQLCGPDGGSCPGASLYAGVAFAQDGTSATAYSIAYSPDTQHGVVDDVPATAPSGFGPVNFSAVSFDEQAGTSNEHFVTGFAYQPATNQFALAVDYDGDANKGGQIDIGPLQANAPFVRVIGSSSNLHSLLDISVSGTALDADGTVYVAGVAGSGYINVYAPGANGDVAPERRITGAATLLSQPLSLALYIP